MDTLTTIEEIRSYRRVKRLKQPIGLVPTMGDLHQGHLQLIDACKKRCETCITTVFVNPMQFGPKEDFGSYPRTLLRDQNELERRNVDMVFAPNLEEMYPDGQLTQTTVSVPSLSNILCGRSRPGHFDGVTTVVAKLLLITQPDVAFFGEKDWQQLIIIQRMARQLNFPVEIKGVPTCRESDGLAMSSRNRYLTADERAIAPTLFLTLRQAATWLQDGRTDYSEIEDSSQDSLQSAGFVPDYFQIREPHTLERPGDDHSPVRIFAAARLGRARLIDNVAVDR